MNRYIVCSLIALSSIASANATSFIWDEPGDYTITSARTGQSVVVHIAPGYHIGTEPDLHPPADYPEGKPWPPPDRYENLVFLHGPGDRRVSIDQQWLDAYERLMKKRANNYVPSITELTIEKLKLWP